MASPAPIIRRARKRRNSIRALANYLTRPRTLWASFAATLMLSLVFLVVMAVWDFAIIDEMVRPDAVRAHVEAMSPEQRRAHAWLTGTVDVAYPFAYASLFAGLALRYLGRAGPVVAVACAAIIPFDLAEGLSQVFVLNGHWEWLAVKAVATPIKLALYIPCLIAALIAVAVAGVRMWRRRKSSP